jgi:hypothetical protein
LSGRPEASARVPSGRVSTVGRMPWTDISRGFDQVRHPIRGSGGVEPLPGAEAHDDEVITVPQLCHPTLREPVDRLLATIFSSRAGSQGPGTERTAHERPQSLDSRQTRVQANFRGVQPVSVLT